MGNVTLNGLPLSNGSVNFIPIADTKGPNGGGSIAAGHYSIHPSRGLVAGKYKVEIRSPRATGKRVYIHVVPPAKQETAFINEMVEVVPAHYNSQSSLEVEINSSSNKLDFDLVGEVPSSTPTDEPSIEEIMSAWPGLSPQVKRSIHTLATKSR